MKSSTPTDDATETLSLNTKTTDSSAELVMYRDGGGVYLNTYGTKPSGIVIQSGGNPAGVGGTVDIVAGNPVEDPDGPPALGDITIIAGNSITLSAKTIDIRDASGGLSTLEAGNFTNTAALQYHSVVPNILSLGVSNIQPYRDAAGPGSLLSPGVYVLTYEDTTDTNTIQTTLLTCKRVWAAGVETRQWIGTSNFGSLGITGSSGSDNTIVIRNGSAGTRTSPYLALYSLFYFPIIPHP